MVDNLIQSIQSLYIPAIKTFKTILKNIINTFIITQACTFFYEKDKTDIFYEAHNKDVVKFRNLMGEKDTEIIPWVGGRVTKSFRE